MFTRRTIDSLVCTVERYSLTHNQGIVIKSSDVRCVQIQLEEGTQIFTRVTTSSNVYRIFWAFVLLPIFILFSSVNLTCCIPMPYLAWIEKSLVISGANFQARKNIRSGNNCIMMKINPYTGKRGLLYSVASHCHTVIVCTLNVTTLFLLVLLLPILFIMYDTNENSGHFEDPPNATSHCGLRS